jgi:hypothetical protein
LVAGSNFHADPPKEESNYSDAVTISPAKNANFSRESAPSHYYAAGETSASTVSVQAPAGNQLENFFSTVEFRCLLRRYRRKY